MNEYIQLRVRNIKVGSSSGRYILYWIQGAPRSVFNFGLEFAIYLSNEYRLPLIVLIIVNPFYPEANDRSMKFFLEGVKELKNALEERGLTFHVRPGKFQDVITQYYKDAKVLITDASYLPFLRILKEEVYKRLDATIFEVDNNLLVPVRVVSSKQEVGAYTLRPKILKIYRNFLDFQEVTYKGEKLEPVLEVDLDNFDSFLKMHYQEKFPETPFRGGEKQGRMILKHFLESNFHQFAMLRSNPAFDVESHLSPYLHYGFISPLEIIKEASKVDTDSKNFDVLFEQLVVRRELAHNFTYYSEDLDDLARILPRWAYESLKNHENDRREYLYSKEELEDAKTHDVLWNAAQKELVFTGKIHNYMRMYWGKKVIEWTSNIDEAYRILVYLNNKYAMDGRDPNSYAGIGWCFGLHDRPFKERPVLGTVRYMSERGLRSKFEVEKYLARVAKLVGG
ncbi:MAG: deoxyribodipyrimidine photo-lyase [candidate division WOR-3 bacterium]